MACETKIMFGHKFYFADFEVRLASQKSSDEGLNYVYGCFLEPSKHVSTKKELSKVQVQFILHTLDKDLYYYWLYKSITLMESPLLMYLLAPLTDLLALQSCLSSQNLPKKVNFHTPCLSILP